MKEVNFNELVGKTLTKIDLNENRPDWSNVVEVVTFHCTSGEKYCMKHEQDCCEHVYLEDVCGDFEDLIGVPILLAEKISNSELPALEDGEDSWLWTFFKIATIKGSVTLRWYGTSNGYYSEDVDFIQI